VNEIAAKVIIWSHSCNTCTKSGELLRFDGKNNVESSFLIGDFQYENEFSSFYPLKSACYRPRKFG